MGNELEYGEIKPITGIRIRMFAAKAGALLRFVSLAAYLLSNAALAASWTASVDQRNWEQGTYVINTPCSQGATGWIGNRPITFPISKSRSPLETLR